MNKTLLLAFLFIGICTSAQQSDADSLKKDVGVIKKKLAAIEWLNKFKISGYVQVQYQHADTVGAKSFAGGDFPAASSDRFKIRRGRFKLEFANTNPKGVVNYYATLQIDMTEQGVTPIEFYGRIVDPWTNWLGLSGGMMNRPFGYEIIQSSRVRETPERGRMSQILFPRERDLGFMFTIEPPKSSKYNFFKINAGMFNGTGLGNAEIDKFKDFIGQVVLHKEFLKNKIRLSGGASYYNGRVLQSTPNYYLFDKDSTETPHYKLYTDSGKTGKGFFKREYIGFDLQFSADYKWGQTTLRGEYIFGTEPGTANSDAAPIATGLDIYSRKFNGLYAYFVQSFHDTKHNMWHDLVFKYDFFDPNTRLKGAALNSAYDAKLSGADVSYHTFGVGYIFRPNEWVKMMFHYDIVLNESTRINGYTRDLKDNVLTIRTQFAFK
jgi:hypothetical protein